MMLDSDHDGQNQKMNAGDSDTVDHKTEGENPKLSSTLRSFLDTSKSTSILRSPKENDALLLLSELLSKNMKVDGSGNIKGHVPTIPVNDLRGEEASVYSREECVLRRSLAALYRLVDMHGWTHSIYNHISARAPDNPKHFLINPFGLLYHEIQASSFVKIDEEGNIVHRGSTVLGVNKAGWTLHSALHTGRPDVNCIVHVHLPDVIAVSCIRAGLLPVSPEANELLISSGVRYHEYRGILVQDSEKESIQTDLGPKAKVLFLRNHGVAVAASDVPEAWYLLKRVVAACQTQMRMLQLAGGASLLTDLKEAAAHLTDGPVASAPRPFSDMDSEQETHPIHDGSMLNGKADDDSADSSWTPAELEFEAEMRVLDSAGFRTGHVYRQPNLLRRAHPGSAWTGDTLGDQMTGAELLTTDFSATEFSATDDNIAAAEAAGAQQVAKIMGSVKANRLKSAQRNQWLSDKRDPTAPNLVTSSMIASPVSIQPTKCTPVKPNSYAPSVHSPVSTPVKRLDDSSPASATVNPSVRSEIFAPYTNGNQSPGSVPRTPSDKQQTPFNRSATLPAKVQNSAYLNSHNTGTLQSTDGVRFDSDQEQKPNAEKKIKKKGSFRIPSFSRKKKH